MLSQTGRFAPFDLIERNVMSKILKIEKDLLAGYIELLSEIQEVKRIVNKATAAETTEAQKEGYIHEANAMLDLIIEEHFNNIRDTEIWDSAQRQVVPNV